MPSIRPATPAATALRLELEPASNGLWFHGEAQPGRRRWEAALLALLARQHGRAARPCHAADLHDALAGLGQQAPLNRKQISRLLDSLDELFTQQGLDLAVRLRHAPRQRTVGPWWWQAQPGDRLTVRATHAPRSPATPAAVRAGRVAALPQLAREPGLPAVLAMCRLALSYQPSWEGGPYASVLPILADGRPWRLAAPEMRAMRWLMITSSYLHTRQLGRGSASLARAERILACEPVAAAYLGTWAGILRLGLARIDSDDRHRRQAADLQEETLAQLPGSLAPEADRLSRLFLFTFAALSEQQALWKAMARHGRTDTQFRVLQTTRLFSAALFCALTGRHFDYMVSVLAHVGSFAHGLLEAGLETDVRQPLEWFILANQASHKMGLTDATGLAAAGLAHCWLSLPQARRAFDTLARQRRWAGPRPDSLTFYLRNRDETRAWGDPRYQGKALLNLLRFTREFGLPAEARRAAQEWQRLSAASPGLSDLLRSEGWPAPQSAS